MRYVGAVVKGEDGTKNSTVVVGLNIISVILDSELLINAPKEITTWCAIDADSINYSPSRTLTDSEIRMLLDQIRRGF